MARLSVNGAFQALPSRGSGLASRKKHLTPLVWLVLEGSPGEGGSLGPQSELLEDHHVVSGETAWEQGRGRSFWAHWS